MRSQAGSVIDLGDGRWRVFVERTVGGQRVRKSKVVRGTRREAELYRLKMLAEELGPIPSDITVQDYITAVYLPAKFDSSRLTTYESYERRCRVFILPLLGGKRLRDVRASTVLRWLSTIEGEKRRKEARRMLSMVMAHAVQGGVIEANPAAALGRMTVEVYRPVVLDAEDIEVYLWHFRGTPAEPQVLLALGGGFRRGEICALDAEDVDPITGIVTIDDAFVAAGEGHMHHEKVKTVHGIREVVLPPSILKRLLEVMPEHGPICHTYDGRRVHPQYISTAYRRRLETLPEGVPRLPLKNLRHTSLTLAYDSGADILAVSRRAGHSSTGITARFYLRPQGIRDRLTAEGMDAALGGKAGKHPSVWEDVGTMPDRPDHGEGLSW